MKKIFILTIMLFVFSPFCLFADWNGEERVPFRIKDRSFELGIARITAGFGNDFLTSGDIFQEKLTVDLDNLRDGFRIDLDVGVTPFYFNYNRNNLWGFGLSVGVDVTGNVNLSGSMLTISDAEKDASYISAAAFGEVKLSSFFHINRFKVTANPSFYYPIMYIAPVNRLSSNRTPQINYTFRGDGPEIDLHYDLMVFTAFPLEDDFALSSSIGVDLHLGAEYPLAEVLGLNNLFSFLNFKVGVDFINIPIAPASIQEYMRMIGHVTINDDMDIFEGEFDQFIDIGDSEYHTEKISVLRPFKMLVWADWKPFEYVPINFIPILGFAINPLHLQPGSMEAGIRTRIDLANLFITTIGIGYHDRRWTNTVDFALNARFLELNIGVGMRSQNFAKSWSGGGFNVNFGLKFGG